jgi:hypothetical protein
MYIGKKRAYIDSISSVRVEVWKQARYAHVRHCYSNTTCPNIVYIISMFFSVDEKAIDDFRYYRHP